MHIDFENFWGLTIEYDFWNDAGLNDIPSDQVSNWRLLVTIRRLLKQNF
jgi:hypothetical protein